MAQIPAPNLLDRAIAALAPEYAVRRQRARMQLALVGGYAGARRNKPGLAGWSSAATDAESDINPDLPELRARTRDLARNSPLAGGAIGTTVTNVVGTGLSLCPEPSRAALGLSEEQAQAWQTQVQAEWSMWAETAACDCTRVQTFYGLQALAFRAALESGDVFCLLPNVPRTDGMPYRLALQLIEADRVCNPNYSADSDTVSAGVELGAFGQAVAYHVARRHPGNLRTRADQQWQRVPVTGAATGRRGVIHLFDRRRPGQVRGVPMLAPVIEPLKQLARYTEAELQAAVISGMFAIFIKMDPDAFHGLLDDDGRKAYLGAATQWDGTLSGATLDGAGKAVNLLPGEEVSSANPGRPNEQFDPFVQAIIRQVGVALEIPFEVLVKHFTASYSAARAALLDAWKFFRGRRDWLAMQFCQPVYETWLAEAVASGRIAAPGFFADPAIRHAWCQAKWIGDGPGSIDPAKEVAAARERVEMGISTLAAESILHDGGDWRSKHEQRVIEERARRDAGLSAAAAPAAPAALPAPDDQDDAGTEDDDDVAEPGQRATPPRAPDAPRPSPRRGARRGDALLANMIASPGQPTHDPALAAAVGALGDAVRTIGQQAADRPPQTVVINPPQVHLQAGDTHVEAIMPAQPAPTVEVHPEIVVQAGDTHVEAIMPAQPAPQVTVQSAAAQVVVQHPTESRTRIVRDAETDEAVETVTTYSLPTATK